MLAHETLNALRKTLDCQPIGAPAGNLSLARGRIDGTSVHVAIIENRFASGALGVAESDKLASLFRIVATQKSPLVIYLDSAGAKVSEGLPALGAFRHMYRAALAVAASGAPVAAFCGANCFGGASMLVSLAGTRWFSANTRFAMSGPAILAQNAGVSVLDDMFQAISHAAIGMESRARLGAGNAPAASDSFAAGLSASPSPLEARHTMLGERLAGAKVSAPGPANKIERKDLAKLYPEGYAIVEQGGVLSGEARYEGKRVAVLGLVGGQPLGAERAWRLADLAWKKVTDAPGALHILVDCESHTASLDDEKLMLSAYLADLASALFALSRNGTHVETVVLGKLGGGVYVATCAPASAVSVLHGTEIQVLPGKAIASILGDAGTQKHEFAEYRAARVAERELKLGLV